MSRSLGEIAFRARQEAANLRFWIAPPKLPAGVSAPSPLPQLPDPITVAGALRGSCLAGEIDRLADQIIAHRFPILGYEIDTGADIDWHRDYVHQRTSGQQYFRRVPYLDFGAVGDHKVIWELNRHQHLVTLAQAFLLSGRRDAVTEIERQLESWWEQNPPGCGINWASALEAAFRVLSWVWVWHLAGRAFSSEFAERLLGSLYQHGRYLRENLSIYFSPNTHLLGEAVALHALGVLFPSFPGSREWRRLGRETTVAQIAAQTFGDGAHFEKSSYYHLYALDMFLLHAVLETPPPEYLKKLESMAEYAWMLAGPGWEIPLLGDDDGGRLFHPYGERAQFCRASLAACAAYLGRPERQRSADDAEEISAWWLGPGRGAKVEGQPFRESRLLEESGLALMASGDTQLVVDVQGFGAAGAGHSHANALSIVCRRGTEWLLVDPGTYTYVADPAARAAFRGTAAHNTLQIDGADQAVASGPFRWREKPESAVRRWSSNQEVDELEAECRYRGFVHRRQILFRKPDVIIVVDSVEGPAGDHTLEIPWRAADHRALAWISFARGTGTREENSSWSRVFGRKEDAPSVVATWRGELPATVCTVIDLRGLRHEVSVSRDEQCVRVSVDGLEVNCGTP